ncbi:tripartite motif-containing protein 44-like [Bombina bombina]|uniref:tripartite motif-containing protein 44-like n=1 Tax=Bombina bombina TaxID=8345 RepID=UPI00235A9B0F|nr:tripartite motif-containing protein 44-like [Bombina bombina]
MASGEVGLLPPDGTCDACEPDEPREAAEICDDCGFSFCDTHAEEHRAIFPGHSIRDFSQELPAALGTSNEQPETDDKKKCPTHNQELSLYCREDKEIICVLCAVTGNHRQHQLITLREAYLEMKNRKPVDLKMAMTEMIERLKSKCADPRVSRGDIKAFVQMQFEHMRQLVQEEEHRALHFVDLQEAMASAHVTEVLEELNVTMGNLMTEMVEVTRQLNSFNQIAMERDEDPEDNSREDGPSQNSAAEGSSRSYFKDPPKGNGPW